MSHSVAGRFFMELKRLTNGWKDQPDTVMFTPAQNRRQSKLSSGLMDLSTNLDIGSRLVPFGELLFSRAGAHKKLS